MNCRNKVCLAIHKQTNLKACKRSSSLLISKSFLQNGFNEQVLMATLGHVSELVKREDRTICGFALAVQLSPFGEEAS